jgi:hypothetical protein
VAGCARYQGVLVVGSGFMTHGLPFLTREALTGAVTSVVDGFFIGLAKRSFQVT